MSDSWLAFDPLAHRKGKPAAPVTSMEQVEVKPSKQDAQDKQNPQPDLNSSSSPTEIKQSGKDSRNSPQEPSSPSSSSSSNNKDEDTPSNDGPKDTEKHPITALDNLTVKADSKSHSPSPVTNDLEFEDSTEPNNEFVNVNVLGEAIPEREDTSENKHNMYNVKQDNVRQDNVKQENDKQENDKQENDKQEIDKQENDKQENDKQENDKQENDKQENEKKEANEQENEKKETVKETTEGETGTGEAHDAPNWPPTHSPESLEDLHAGDLRKNSIAAMKELGDPITSPIANQSENTDGAVASFDFQKFMTSLRTKSADPISRYIKSFLQEFSRAVWTPKQQEKIVSDFQKFIAVKLRDFEPFASMSKQDRLNSLEGVEKLIMNRIYTRTFPPVMPPILRTDGHTEDLLNDEVFEEKMRLWGWVEGRHLDINEEYLKSTFIQLATTELGRLHQFKSPRDKTICILNCSKVIYALIRQARLEQNADSFLPLLIYVVLKAHPVHLVSTINYIQRFRSKEFQRGETGYYLSTLASAVAFVQSLDQSSLTITQEEFEQHMSESAKAENQRKHQQLAEHELVSQGTEVHEGESSAAVLTASAGMLVDRMRKLTTKFLEDLAAPEETSPPASSSSTNRNEGERSAQRSHARGRQTSRSYRQEEQAAKDASRGAYLIEQAQREQFNETLETLKSMFPTLDHDLIEDVMRQNGSNVGSAVDVCLALVG